MDLNLSGRTALVVGGNTGIGRAVSRALAGYGADMALTYYAHEEEGRQTAAEIEALGRKAFCLALDATDSAQVNRVFRDVAAALGGHIDILMNNAGTMVARTPISEMTDEYWRKVLDLNATSTFYGLREVLPFMHTGWGRIINMSSLAAHVGGGPGAAAYAASKAAVIALTRGAAKEFAPRGITVNAVAPGLILETYFHETYSTPENIAASIRGIPLGRGGVPDDVAGAVLYLASDLAAFVTGEVIEINGGANFA